MIKNIFNLENEVAIVIGATGVLGGGMAEALAQAGAKVAVCGRSQERGTACVSRIAEAGGTSAFFTLDSSSKESLHTAHIQIEAELGAPSILINAAGGNDPKVTVTPDNPFESIQTEDWQSAFDMNLVGGIVLPCQEFGPAMVKRGRGSIINIASVSAHLPLSRVVAYSAAKAAVLNLTQFLGREWAPFGVRVNSITPGFFPADQNRKLLYQDDGTPTPRAQSILTHTPMRRFGTADELRGAVLFLASESASSFVTATDIRVDGGFLSQTI